MGIRRFIPPTHLFISLLLTSSFFACNSSRKSTEYAYLIKNKEDKNNKKNKAETSLDPEAIEVGLVSDLKPLKNKKEDHSSEDFFSEDEYFGEDEAPSKLKKRVSKVISEAESYLGTPYLYGGNSRKGMDCSGLMCQAFKAVDKQLPRSSRLQAQMGRNIKKKDIREGDLLFFSTNGTGRINHVGLVVKVKGSDVQFIHATTSRGVRKDYLDTPYWADRYIKAVNP